MATGSCEWVHGGELSADERANHLHPCGRARAVELQHLERGSQQDLLLQQR